MIAIITRTTNIINNGRRLYNVYAIPAAVSMAEPLPANGDMAADTWYYFDNAIAGDAYAATATDLAAIECIEYSTGNAVTLDATANSLAAIVLFNFILIFAIYTIIKYEASD